MSKTALTLYVEDDRKLGFAIRETAMAHNWPSVQLCRTLAEARQSLTQETEYGRIVLDVALLDGVGTDLLPDLAQAEFLGDIIIVSGIIEKDWTDDVLARAAECGLSIRFLEKTGNWVKEAFGR